MPRISTNRDKQRRPYSASAENTTRREIRVPSPLEEVKLDALRLLLGFTDLDCGTATFVPLTHTIAGLTANPLDLIHAALVELIEDGDLTYRFDGSMRCFRTFAPVLGSVEARDEHRAGNRRRQSSGRRSGDGVAHRRTDGLERGHAQPLQQWQQSCRGQPDAAEHRQRCPREDVLTGRHQKRNDRPAGRKRVRSTQNRR
jgi:hypothetical protein